MEDVENFGEKLDAMKTGDSLFIARLGWVFRVPNGFIYQTEGVFVPDSPKTAVVETKDVKADEVETKADEVETKDVKKKARK